MRGWLTIVVVSVALMPTSIWAQRRGGGAAPRPVMGGRFPSPSRGPIFAPRASGFRGSHPGFPFSDNGFNHRFPHRRFGFGWPYYYNSYLGYYPWYPLFGDTYSNADDYQPQNYAAPQEPDPMSAEAERLREEVAELRSRPSIPPPQQQARKETAPTPTTLVLRNGKSEQVQNYAITEETIWVFDEPRMKKIPLSELNIPATKTANEQRGVSFQILPAR